MLSDGEVLIVGGLSPSGQTLHDAQLWNRRTGQVAALAGTLSVARHDHTARLQADGSVLIEGGIDQGGNKITASEVAVTLPANVTGTTSYNADNEQSTFNGASLSYDANGNLTGDGTNTYTFDARNHLTAISGGATASFVYDGFGRRMSKTINGTTTQFLYDGLNPVQELNGSNGVVANLLTGLRVDEYFTRTDTATSTLLADALGSTVGLVGSGGSIATNYTYQPFGAATTGGSANGNSYQFTGRENDGTGLYFYRARYYSPALQRFISQDPIGFGGGDTNLYAYVLNAPSYLYDPLGLAWGDWQNVTGSREGTPAAKTPSGYNTATDPFAALPEENMQGSQIEVEANGRTITIPIGDIGPWNGGHTRSGRSLDDPYWDTNSTPQACSGTDKRGRPTNGAGIDLSDEAIRQLGLDPRQGLYDVRWRGLPSNMPSPDVSDEQLRDLGVNPRRFPTR